MVLWGISPHPLYQRWYMQGLNRTAACAGARRAPSTAPQHRTTAATVPPLRRLFESAVGGVGVLDSAHTRRSNPHRALAIGSSPWLIFAVRAGRVRAFFLFWRSQLLFAVTELPAF